MFALINFHSPIVYNRQDLHFGEALPAFEFLGTQNSKGSPELLKFPSITVVIAIVPSDVGLLLLQFVQTLHDAQLQNEQPYATNVPSW